MKFIDHETYLIGEYCDKIDICINLRTLFKSKNLFGGFQYLVADPSPYCFLLLAHNTFVKNFDDSFVYPINNFWLNEYRNAVKEYHKYL